MRIYIEMEENEGEILSSVYRTLKSLYPRTKLFLLPPMDISWEELFRTQLDKENS